MSHDLDTARLKSAIGALRAELTQLLEAAERTAREDRARTDAFLGLTATVRSVVGDMRHEAKYQTDEIGTLMLSWADRLETAQQARFQEWMTNRDKAPA